MAARRALHVITRLTLGGSAENTIQTVLGLRERGFECDLASGLGAGELSIVDRARALGVAPHLLPELVREVRPFSDLRALVRLVRLIRWGRYTIVHTHTSKAGALGRLAARLCRTPIIVHTPHGHVFYGYYGSGQTAAFVWVEWLAARITDRIITLTEIEAAEHRDRGIGRPGQFVAIPSGVDLERFRDRRVAREGARARLGFTLSHRLLVSIGRLVPVKGYRYLIEALPRILAALPAAELLLVGDGEERGSLRELADRLGVLPHVHFLGIRDEVPEILDAADLFVLPSVNEGMGRVLVEALAAGLPVVATAVGGVPELIRHGETGLLVPPANPSALAEAILSLLRDPEGAGRLAAAGRRQIGSEYSLGAMVDRIAAVYEAVRAAKGLTWDKA